MYKELLPKSLLILILSVLALPLVVELYGSGTSVAAQTDDTQGSLTVIDSGGNPKSMCPLKHTEVKAEITGFISRVVVTQQFENPFKEKIEAVYTFPLPQNAAVDVGECLSRYVVPDKLNYYTSIIRGAYVRVTAVRSSDIVPARSHRRGTVF